MPWGKTGTFNIPTDRYGVQLRLAQLCYLSSSPTLSIPPESIFVSCGPYFVMEVLSSARSRILSPWGEPAVVLTGQTVGAELRPVASTEQVPADEKDWKSRSRGWVLGAGMQRRCRQVKGCLSWGGHLDDLLTLGRGEFGTKAGGKVLA